MNFNLTDEQKMIYKMMKEFADEVVAPGSVERDRNHAFPKEIFD